MSALIVLLILIAIYFYLYSKKEFVGGGAQSHDAEFVIYYSYDCPFCLKALQLLKDNHAAYEAIEITDLQNTLKLLGNKLPSSHKTKPIIFLRGKFLGGYTQLAEYYKRKSV